MSICGHCGHTNESNASHCLGCGQHCVEVGVDVEMATEMRSAFSLFDGTDSSSAQVTSLHPGAIVHQARSPAISTNDIGLMVPKYDDFEGDQFEEEATEMMLPAMRPGSSFQEFNKAPFSPFQTEDLPTSPVRDVTSSVVSVADADSDEERLSLHDMLDAEPIVLQVEQVESKGDSHNSQSFLHALRADPLLGTRLGRYQIIRKIGSGGFGSVYEAEQDLLERKVAIKILQINHHEAVTKERFFREARALGRLRHKNIVQIVDFGELEGEALYLVMELLDGPSLREFVQKQEPFPMERTQRIIGQLCEALEYIHERQIYHRDLKPANILLIEHPSYGEMAKLIDFGVASMAEEENALTRTGACLGSPSYMSPEQARGDTRDVDGRSDLYSLGILLYQMLTGKLPFYAPNFAAMLSKHLFASPPPLAEALPSLSWAPALEQFIQYAMAKDPTHRPPDAATFARDCKAALEAQQERLAALLSPSHEGHTGGVSGSFASLPMPPMVGTPTKQPLVAAAPGLLPKSPKAKPPPPIATTRPRRPSADGLPAASSSDFLRAAQGSGSGLFDRAEAPEEETIPLPIRPDTPSSLPATSELIMPDLDPAPWSMSPDTESPGHLPLRSSAPPSRGLGATVLDMDLPAHPQSSPHDTGNGGLRPQRLRQKELSATLLDATPSWSGLESVEAPPDAGHRKWMLGALVLLFLGGGIWWALSTPDPTSPSTAGATTLSGGDAGQPAPRAQGPTAVIPRLPQPTPRTTTPEDRTITPEDRPIVMPLALGGDGSGAVPSGDERTRPPTPDGSKTPSGRALWTVKLQTQPAAALIWQAGKRLGQTPATLQWPAGTMLRLRLRRRGYETKQIRVQLTQETTRLNVQLQRSKRRIRRRPPPPRRDLYGIGDPI